MNPQTRAALVNVSHRVGKEHLGWMRVVYHYSLEIPWIKMEPVADFIDIYQLVEEAVTSTKAPSLILRVLDKLRIPCSEFLASVSASHRQNNVNVKLEFVLALMDVVRDLTEDIYKHFRFLVTRSYFEHYHPSRFHPRWRLIKRLLDKDIIGPTNFGIVYAFLEQVGCSSQHWKLDRYCEQQSVEKPDWRAFWVQPDPSSLSDGAEFSPGNTPSSMGSYSRIPPYISPRQESGVPQQETTSRRGVRLVPAEQTSNVDKQYTEGRNVLVTGFPPEDGDSIALEESDDVGPQPRCASLQLFRSQPVSTDGPLPPRPSSQPNPTVSKKSAVAIDLHNESESNFSNVQVPNNIPPVVDVQPQHPKTNGFGAKGCQKTILISVLTFMSVASLAVALLFGIGPYHVKEVEYIGGNIAVLLHREGFDSLFVESVTVMGQVTRPEEETEGTFFLTPCNSLLTSARHFPMKLLGHFSPVGPQPISINYFQTSEPILSEKLPGILTYYINASSNQSYSYCPINISITDHKDSREQSDCLLWNFSSNQPPTTYNEVNFSLQVDNFYYAYLSMEVGVEASISAELTVNEYNVSDLQPLSCRLLHSEDKKCVFNLTNSSYPFYPHKQCLIGRSVSLHSAPYFNVSLTTTAHHVHSPYFIISSVVFLISCITLCIVLIVFIPCNTCRRKHLDYEVL